MKTIEVNDWTMEMIDFILLNRYRESESSYGEDREAARSCVISEIVSEEYLKITSKENA